MSNFYFGGLGVVFLACRQINNGTCANNELMMHGYVGQCSIYGTS